MAEKREKTKAALHQISDVAEWGDRYVETKLFGDMSEQELREVEERAKQLPTPRIHRRDDDE